MTDDPGGGGGEKRAKEGIYHREERRQQRHRDPTEGVRLIGADEAAEALEHDDIRHRLRDDEPRFGDPAHLGRGRRARPALRFPLGSYDDPTTIERPPVVPVQPPTEAPELSHWAGSAAEEVPKMNRRDPRQGDDPWSTLADSDPRWRDDPRSPARVRRSAAAASPRATHRPSRPGGGRGDRRGLADAGQPQPSDPSQGRRCPTRTTSSRPRAGRCSPMPTAAGLRGRLRRRGVRRRVRRHLRRDVRRCLRRRGLRRRDGRWLRARVPRRRHRTSPPCPPTGSASDHG